MGDILDRLSENITYNDVSHNWTTIGKNDSVEEFFNSPQNSTSEGDFLEDGYKLIQQTFPFKGIRFGGTSTFDRKETLSGVLNLSLSNAARNRIQDNLDKLIAETFYGNSSDEASESSNQPCGSAGAEGVFNGEYWMGQIKMEWIATTSAKVITTYGDYSEQVFDTLNNYAPKYNMAPARALAQLMVEGGHTVKARDQGNTGGGATGAKGIGQFLRNSWPAPYERAVKKFPELKKYKGAWSDHSSQGGPGHPVLGTIVMLEYMDGIHNHNMEKTLPGKDEDFWWSALGYLQGPGLLAKVLKRTNGDRTKVDAQLKDPDIWKHITGTYRKKGVEFYANGILQKWGEYSKAVPKSERDPLTEADEPETQVSNCEGGAAIGDATSKVKWTPGQELADFSGTGRFSASGSAYGVPKGKSGQPWMAGDSPGNKNNQGSLHVEFEAALNACFKEMQKAGHKPWSLQSSPGFRSYKRQQELYKGRGTATPGNSAHGTGYAVDLWDSGNKIDSNSHSERQAWMHKNASRWGIFFPLYKNGTGLIEVWHAQLHPDLAYTLKDRWEARGKKWD